MQSIEDFLSRTEVLRQITDPFTGNVITFFKNGENTTVTPVFTFDQERDSLLFSKDKDDVFPAPPESVHRAALILKVNDRKHIQKIIDCDPDLSSLIGSKSFSVIPIRIEGIELSTITNAISSKHSTNYIVSSSVDILFDDIHKDQLKDFSKFIRARPLTFNITGKVRLDGEEWSFDRGTRTYNPLPRRQRVVLKFTDFPIQTSYAPNDRTAMFDFSYEFSGETRQINQGKDSVILNGPVGIRFNKWLKNTNLLRSFKRTEFTVAIIDGCPEEFTLKLKFKVRSYSDTRSPYEEEIEVPHRFHLSKELNQDYRIRGQTGVFDPLVFEIGYNLSTVNVYD